MSKRAKLLTGVGIGLVVLVVAVLVGTRLYAGWVNNNADEAPSLAEQSPSGDATGDTGEQGEAASLDGDWGVTDGSYAGYRVEEVLNGQDVTVTGRTEEVTGSVTIADGTLVEGSVEVDMDSVSTPESQRDAFFRSTALETEQFPTATFEVTEPVAVVGDGADISLVGDLTVHGVTQQVTATAQAGPTGDGLQVVGSIPITFADFDVEAPDLGFVVVEETGAIEFSLELAAG